MDTASRRRAGSVVGYRDRVVALLLVAGLTVSGWPSRAEAAEDGGAVPLPVMPNVQAKKATNLSIRHSPLKCVTPVKRPKVEAKALPGVNATSGYAFYRMTGTKSYYYVRMERGVRDDFNGVLPRPEWTTKSIDYYLQALNKKRAKAETSRYQPEVLPDEKDCKRGPEQKATRSAKRTTGKSQAVPGQPAKGPAGPGPVASKSERDKAPAGEKVPEAAKVAEAEKATEAERKTEEAEEKLEGLTIGLTEEGQDPVPPGFRKEDIGKVILVTGVIVTLASLLGAGAATAPAIGVAPAATAGGTASGTAGAAGGGTAATTGGTAGGTAAAGGGAGTAGAATGAGTAAAAGGISTGVLIGGGAVVVAGVAVAASSGGGKGGGDTTPTVSLTADKASGTAPLTVTFNASVSSGTSPYTFAWDFGDGRTATGSSPQSHTYSNPSSTPYTAKVTVTDSKGKTATDSKSITVSAPAALSFLEVDASYSGGGNLAITLLSGNGQSVGTAYPTACGPTGNRTVRVILNQPANGSYTVTATGSACPAQNSAGPISAVFSALTNAGAMPAACSPAFRDVPIGSSITACTFSIP